MLGKKGQSTTVDSSTLIAGSGVGKNSQTNNGIMRINVGIMETFRPDRIVPTANEAEASSSFTKEHVDHILALLKSNSVSSGTPSVSVAQSGKEISALSCCLNSSTP
ncbi:hypothetical protein V6N12_049992 [Hibiscus sabdariffa]|uniref:Uncharacterized protein n=1 Tax=Hibiscus sabdariffa TaxID=183260 RepID=A0ABR2GB55_9ROSI